MDLKEKGAIKSFVYGNEIYYQGTVIYKQMIEHLKYL